MNKQHILDEIRRTAEANGGRPLGRERFEKETGTRTHDWYGRFWARWSDALREAGFEPNRRQEALDDDEILPKLSELVRELGRYPTGGELRIREHQEPNFPSVFSRSARSRWIQKLIDYCDGRAGYEDILAICQAIAPSTSESSESENGADKVEVGYVYLALMKVGREKRYKIGKADIVERRTKQIAVQLPEDLELVHTISTDDAYGIEAYWHKRFAGKRRGGEWFDLNSDDVRVFKRRKFM